MHSIGDKWYQAYGNDLQDAISWIQTEMKKAHIFYESRVCNGLNDVSAVSFWNGGLFELIYGCVLHSRAEYRHYSCKWLEKLACSFRNWLRFTVDKKVVCPFTYWTGIHTRVLEHQVDEYNRIYQEAVKKWPYLKEELILGDECGYMWIKPGDYGDVSGSRLYRQYWKDYSSTALTAYDFVYNGYNMTYVDVDGKSKRCYSKTSDFSVTHLSKNKFLVRYCSDGKMLEELVSTLEHFNKLCTDEGFKENALAKQ